MNDRGHLETERRNPRSADLDRLTIADAFALMNAEDAAIATAVAAARHEICHAIEWVVRAFRNGGRLIYVGAGTSGRLGMLDAVECPPTFLTDPAMVQCIIAGDLEALTRSVEGAEDRTDRAEAAIDERAVTSNDVVFGIAAGGTTPFVHAALRRARQRGAPTVFLACVPHEQMPDEADISIRVLTGPEVLTGSTRLKAGTATKMVLNMLTTIAMVQLGKTYENLMVDVNTAANAKLVDRGIRILCDLTGVTRPQAATLLKDAGGHVKTALVMHLRQVTQPEAVELLRTGGGRLAQVIAPVHSM